MFVALPGTKYDGHDFIDESIQAGAICIVCQKDGDYKADCIIQVPDTRHALALLAARFYNFPSRKLKVAGITGTNGKTTTVYMVKSIFDERLKRSGLIGTIEYLAGSYQFKAFNTTPESLHLERLMSIMLQEKLRNVVMEVSSHGLKTGRVKMIDFNVVALTNLTQDHLDFHGTMEEYREAKAILFDKVKGKDKWAVLNMDDPSYDFFLARSDCSYLAYSLNNPKADVRIGQVENQDDGYTFMLYTPLGDVEIYLKLQGSFNLNNALCAAAVALASGVDPYTIKRGLEGMTFVPGRMEPVNIDKEFKVFIDYAHTPDALSHVMKSAKELADENRLVAVFGCGGDRDKEKRPLMAKAVSEHADVIVLTTDNPRTEDPQSIIDDTRKGLDESKEVHVIADRKEAIRKALEVARPGDVVVIAGKGHEDYQIIGEEKQQFDDRDIVREVTRA
jgi:UDP-N-acetylmuramoyl-L-alanyl-D-glutamate--2,6-diaminopimelate ligase